MKGMTITFKVIFATILLAVLLLLVIIVFTQANLAHMGPKTICTLTATGKSLIVNMAGGWQNLPVISSVVAAIPVICPVYMTNPLNPVIGNHQDFMKIFGDDLVDCWQQYGDGKYSPLWGIENPKLCAQIPYEFAEELLIRDVGTFLHTKPYTPDPSAKTYEYCFAFSEIDCAENEECSWKGEECTNEEFITSYIDLVGNDNTQICRIPAEIKKSFLEELTEGTLDLLCTFNPLCLALKIGSGVGWEQSIFSSQKTPCDVGIPSSGNDLVLSNPNLTSQIISADPTLGFTTPSETLTKGTIYMAYFDYQGFLEHSLGYAKIWGLCKNDQQEIGAYVFKEHDAIIICVDDEGMRNTVPQDYRVE